MKTMRKRIAGVCIIILLLLQLFPWIDYQKVGMGIKGYMVGAVVFPLFIFPIGIAFLQIFDYLNLSRLWSFAVGLALPMIPTTLLLKEVLYIQRVTAFPFLASLTAACPALWGTLFFAVMLAVITEWDVWKAKRCVKSMNRRGCE